MSIRGDRMSDLKQYFYVYEIAGENFKHVITERITFIEGQKPDKLDIPGWKGWLDDLVMQGKHPF